MTDLVPPHRVRRAARARGAAEAAGGEGGLLRQPHGEWVAGLVAQAYGWLGGWVVGWGGWGGWLVGWGGWLVGWLVGAGGWLVG